MIQIDVAGWNSLIGGVIVGLYRTNSQAFATETIPPRFFQNPAFGDQAYLDEAVAATRHCFRHLAVPTEELVEICPSFVLSRVRDHLAEAGYDWRPAHIEGPLQERLTRAFWHHLRDLGFHVEYGEYVDPTRRGLVWRQQIAWIKGGDASAAVLDGERASACKTGWGTSEIWSQPPYRIARELAHQRRETRWTL
jgi:hypothetical protein